MESVLIVDDQAHYCQLAREVLSRSPRFQVLGEAYDAKQALKMIPELKPDLVIMDVEMDGINGLEAAHLIQSRFPDVRVVLMSTYDEREYSRMAIQVGALAFIPKRDFSAPALSAILGNN